MPQYHVAAFLREELGQVSSDALDTSELDVLFRDILDRATPKLPKYRDRLRKVLVAVVKIRNPLSARGLGTLLESDPGEIKSALMSLHSVISVPHSLDASILIFHASFPDCLADVTRSRQHFIPSSEYHRILARVCLSLMNSSLNENIYINIPSGDTAITNETVSRHIPEGLSYACMY
jgi:hypothetical protein